MHNNHTPVPRADLTQHPAAHDVIFVCTIHHCTSHRRADKRWRLDRTIRPAVGFNRESMRFDKRFVADTEWLRTVVGRFFPFDLALITYTCSIVKASKTVLTAIIITWSWKKKKRSFCRFDIEQHRTLRINGYVQWLIVQFEWPSHELALLLRRKSFDLFSIDILSLFIMFTGANRVLSVDACDRRYTVYSYCLRWCVFRNDTPVRSLHWKCFAERMARCSADLVVVGVNAHSFKPIKQFVNIFFLPKHSVTVRALLSVREKLLDNSWCVG
jgi:hypothetical protein